jgi:GNAT superfamily N-acetyltransferase
MRRAYKSLARVGNQKMLSPVQQKPYCLRATTDVTHSVFRSKTRLNHGLGDFMNFLKRLATADDLAFSRSLTCQNMLRYYIHHDLLWQDEAFDVAWSGRESWLILQGETVVGFFSLSRDSRALYIRESQIAEAFQGEGAGSWALDQVIDMAIAEKRRRCA